MAPETRSLQSQEFIDVSQNVESSPASHATPDAQKVLVEDSLDPHGPMAQVAAIEHTQAFDEEEDELYANSPQGHAPFDAIRSSAKQSTQVVGETLLEGPLPAPQSPNTLRANQGKARSEAIDSLIDGGAVVSTTRLIKAPAKAMSQPRTKGVKDLLAGTKASARSQPSKQAASRSQGFRNAGKPPPAPTATPRLSAAAQLRNRREAASFTPSITTARYPQQPYKVPTQHPPLHPLYPHASSAALNTPKSDDAASRPATKALRSRREGMLAETPKPVIKVKSTPGKDRPETSSNNRRCNSSISTIEKSQANDDAAYVRSELAAGPPEKPRCMYDLPPPSPTNEKLKIQRALARITSSRKIVTDERVGSPARSPSMRSIPNRSPERVGDSDAEPAPPSKQQALDPSLAPGSCRAGDSTVAGKDATEGKRHKSAQQSNEDFEAAGVEYYQDDTRHVTENAAGIGAADGAKEQPPRPKPVREAAKFARRGLGLNKQSLGALQDDPLLSSDIAPSVHPERSGSGKESSSRPQPQRRNERRPQTRVNLRSSRCIEEAKRSQAHAAESHDTTASPRTATIAFDQSRPRNQRQQSEKKIGLTLALPDRLPWTDSRSQRPPSVVSAASNLRARKAGARSLIGPPSVDNVPTLQTAAPSNIAENVSDALVGLTKAGKSSSENEVVGQTEVSLQRPSIARAETNDNCGEAPFDEDNTTLVPVADDKMSFSNGGYGAILRTASQLVMLPPAVRDRLHVVRAQGEITRHNTPTRMGEEPPVNLSFTNSRMTRKRHGAVEQSGQQTLKKHKPMADGDAPAREDGPHFAGGPIELDHAGGSFHQPLRASRRRMVRNASQGNADIGGSPIPKNMVVPENATVLETFSQHAQLPSFDQSVISDAAARRAAAGDHEADKAWFDSILAALPAHSNSLAGNQKRHPASPQADSAAVTDVVFRALDAERLIINDDSAQPATDPFTSSEEARKEPHKGSSSSQLIEQLRESAPQHGQRRPLRQRQVNANHEAELGDQRHRLVTTNGNARIGEDTATMTRKRKHIAETARNEEHQHARNHRQHHVMTADEQNPEKTLVNSDSEPEPKRARRLPETSKDKPSLAYTSRDEDVGMPAIGTWRHGLQPHQMNLFDELVGISHKLVRHLVDHETAMREAMRDYKARGVRLIEQSEVRQAGVYRRSLDVLEHQRQQQLTRLKELSGNLDGRLGEREQAKAARMQRLTLIDEQQESLKRELAAYA